MKKYLLLLFCCLQCHFLMSQECRNPNDKEKAAIKNFISVFDNNVQPYLSGTAWEIGDQLDIRKTVEIASSASLPERPFMICSQSVYTVDLKLLNPKRDILNDSITTYQNKINNLNAKIFAATNNETTEAAVNAAVKKVQPLIDERHILEYKQGQLEKLLTLQFVTDINAPLLILSSIHGSGLSSACKKINVPGVSVAYLLTLHDVDYGDTYKVVLGLGKWTDNLKKYDFNHDIYLHYHFIHHYLSDVIENVSVSITGGSEKDVMDLVNRINWTNANAALTK